MVNDSEKRAEILQKHWSLFQLAIGNPQTPMSERAKEYMEAAMQEYADSLTDHQKQQKLF